VGRVWVDAHERVSLGVGYPNRLAVGCGTTGTPSKRKLSRYMPVSVDDADNVRTHYDRSLAAATVT
jgi:hypothetical protein